MAKVFVAGATGVAGTPAVAALVGEGHDVGAVARSRDKAGRLEVAGARPVAVDLFDPEGVRQAVSGCDTVVNLATKIPAPARALLPGAWKENDRIRRHASRNLVDACIATGVRRYVQESLAFVYPDRGGAWIDEDAPLDLPAYAASVGDAEREAERFRDQGDAIVLRFGQFYAAGTPHTRAMVAVARRGLSPFVGAPEGFVPLVHAHDVGRAVAAALEAPSGTYNIVDDEPLRRRELSEVLARVLGRVGLRAVPPKLAGAGGAKVRLLMRSERVSNARFTSATGWKPVVQSGRDGLRRVVEETRGANG